MCGLPYLQPMQFKIRIATTKELRTFFQAFTKSVAEDFPAYTHNTILYLLQDVFSLKSLQEEIKKGICQIFLASVNKRIVGYLVSTHPYGGVGFCNWIAVYPDYRKKGLASALLETWEKKAQKDGAHKVHLWTDRRNIEFYKKRGYILVGRIPDNFFGANDYLFYKTFGKSSEKKFLKDFLKRRI